MLNKVTVTLEIPDTDRWDTLDEKYTVSYGRPLEQILFDILFFSLDLKRTELTIEAEGSDAIIDIYFDGNEVKKEISLKQGVVENTLEYELTEISVIKNYGYKIKKKSLREVSSASFTGIVNPAAVSLFI